MPLVGRVHSGAGVADAGDVLLAEPGERVVYEHAWALTGARP